MVTKVSHVYKHIGYNTATITFILTTFILTTFTPTTTNSSSHHACMRIFPSLYTCIHVGGDDGVYAV